VCIKKRTYKTSARFHSLTEISRDRNDQDWKSPVTETAQSETARLSRPDRKVVYPAPATLPRGKAGMKINETHEIYVSLFTSVKCSASD